MNYNEYGQKIQALEAQIEELKQQWIARSPFRAGDKVLYTDHRGQQKTMFVWRIDPHPSVPCLEYVLVPPGADGSMPEEMRGAVCCFHPNCLQRVEEVNAS